MGDEVHTKAVVDQLEAMGERIRDANDQYRGLTSVHLVDLLQELQQRRDASARLRTWFTDHDVKTFPGEHPEDAARRVLDTARSAIFSIIPIASQLWGTYSTVFAKLGVKLPGSQ